jgi:hypothetical protein
MVERRGAHTSTSATAIRTSALETIERVRQPVIPDKEVKKTVLGQLPYVLASAMSSSHGHFTVQYFR